MQQVRKEARLIVAYYIWNRLLGSDGVNELCEDTEDNKRMVRALREVCWMLCNPGVSVSVMPDDYAIPGVSAPYSYNERIQLVWTPEGKLPVWFDHEKKMMHLVTTKGWAVCGYESNGLAAFVEQRHFKTGYGGLETPCPICAEKVEIALRDEEQP